MPDPSFRLFPPMHPAWLPAFLAVGWMALCPVIAAAEPEFESGVSLGLVDDVDPPNRLITEGSGLVASRNNADVLWMHNDSGDQPRLFAVDTQGRVLGVYNLPGAANQDYEDIAIGPGPVPGVDYVYLGDIGSARSNWSELTVYRTAEPAVYTRQHTAPPQRDLLGVDALSLSYPTSTPSSVDAETLMVDPVSGDLLIGTKRPGAVDFYRASAADLHVGGPIALGSPAVTVPLGADSELNQATGGDISVGGNEILLRTYSSATLWQRSAGQSVVDALAGGGTAVPLVGFPGEPQGESIGFDAIGSGYYSHGENRNQATTLLGDEPRPLYYYERTSDDGPRPPMVLLPAGGAWRYHDAGADLETAWREPTFDDGAWSTGEGPLGYGTGYEQTVLDFGGDAADKHATTYFRRTFELDDPADIESLTLKLLFDDGAAVYLNGNEVARVGLTAGAAFDDFASTPRTDLRDTWLSLPLDTTDLVAGTNLLAVEVHQAAPDEADLIFDAQLVAAVPEPSSLVYALWAALLLFVLPGGYLIRRWMRARRSRPATGTPR